MSFGELRSAVHAEDQLRLWDALEGVVLFDHEADYVLAAKTVRERWTGEWSWASWASLGEGEMVCGDSVIYTPLDRAEWRKFQAVLDQAAGCPLSVSVASFFTDICHTEWLDPVGLRRSALFLGCTRSMRGCYGLR